MAALDRLAERASRPHVLTALVLAAVGTAASSAGLTNGDLAAYLDQAEGGSLFERPTHLGYVALARGLGALPGELATALHHLATLCGVLSVFWLPGGLPLLLGLACWLPLVGHGEVDPLALLLVAVAARAPQPWAAVAWGVGLTVSPLVLLSAPWMAAERGARWVLPVTAGVLALLSLPDQGAWWWGHRGLIGGPGWSWRWELDGPLLATLCLVRPKPRDAWLLLGVLAPPDLPRAVLPTLLLLHRDRRRLPSALGGALVALALGLGALGAWRVDQRIRTEQRELDRLVPFLRGGGGLVAPWSLGARASFQATGRVYGARWRVPMGFVRDQQRSWCSLLPERVQGLPADHPQVVITLAEPAAGCPER